MREQEKHCDIGSPRQNLEDSRRSCLQNSFFAYGQVSERAFQIASTMSPANGAKRMLQRLKRTSTSCRAYSLGSSLCSENGNSLNPPSSADRNRGHEFAGDSNRTTSISRHHLFVGRTSPILRTPSQYKRVPIKTNKSSLVNLQTLEQRQLRSTYSACGTAEH